MSRLTDGMEAQILLAKFAEEELRRLAEKKIHLQRGTFDDHEKWMDDFWKEENQEILAAAQARIDRNCEDT